MVSHSYRILIEDKNNEDSKCRELSGTIQELSGGNIVNQKEFDPLTILGDLLNIVTYEEKSPYSQDNYAFKQNYQQFPFFLDREFEGNTQFKKPFSFKPFFIALDELKRIMIENAKLSLSEFEVLKQFLSLKFTFEIEFCEDNPLLELGYAVNPITKEKVAKNQYISLNEIHNFDVAQMFESKKDTSFRFVYSCTSVEDMIFSVLHYLMFFKYQFAKCNHCGNYFATKTLKQKYCRRYSPYQGYEHLNCEQAVRNIKQHFTRRRAHIFDHLSTLYTNEAKYNFDKEYERYKEVVDKCPSVENLRRLEQFLSDENVRKKWYRSDGRIPSPHRKRRQN